MTLHEAPPPRVDTRLTSSLRQQEDTLKGKIPPDQPCDVLVSAAFSFSSSSALRDVASRCFLQLQESKT